MIKHELSPIYRLWILRMMIPLNGYIEFLLEHGYRDDDLAIALGLSSFQDDDDRIFNRQAVLRSLRSMHRQAERTLGKVSLPSVLKNNIDQLSQLLGLNEAEQQLLAFLICLHADARLDTSANLLGELNQLQLIHVLSILLDQKDSCLKGALSGRGVLYRSGLIRVNGDCNYLSRKLDVLSGTFIDRMLSDDADVLSHFRESVFKSAQGTLSLSDYPHIKAELDLLIPYLQQVMETQRKGVNVLIYGPPGTGKTQLAKGVSQELGVDLYEVSSEDEEGDPRGGIHRLRSLMMSQYLISEHSVILLFDEIEDVISNGVQFERSTAQNFKGWINRMLEENPVPTLWVSNDIGSMDPAMIRRFDMVLELPIPSIRLRRTMIKKLGLGEIGEQETEVLVQSEALAPAIISRSLDVIKTIQNRVALDDQAKARQLLINHTLKAQGHQIISERKASQLPNLYDPAFVNADVDLAVLCQIMQENQSIRLCLYGPPGTGKTAFGHWLAGQLDRPLMEKRASDLISKWVGGTEQMIATAFKEAENEQALLLIDEVDGFLQDRRCANHSWEITMVNELLTQIESFSGVFVASTNLMDALDQASLRRFDLKIKFDYLSSVQAWALFNRYCGELRLKKPHRSLRSNINRLSLLTPGDFATVARGIRLMPVKSPQELMAKLVAESDLKEGSKPAIGFIQ